MYKHWKLSWKCKCKFVIIATIAFLPLDWELLGITASAYIPNSVRKEYKKNNFQDILL